MTDDLYVYLYSSYYGTGEGMSNCFMVTRAYPRQEDYEVQPSFDNIHQDKFVYIPGVLKTSREEIAKREFQDKFGWLYSCDVQVVTREEFLKIGKNQIPEYVVNVLNNENQPGNFNWTSCVHVNYS